MKIRVVSAADLTAEQLDAWARLQQSDRKLANPFFRPEFTQLVAAHRQGVEVVVWERSGEPVGFLPFERSGKVGRPVGSYINQFEGAIARDDVAWSPQDMLRAAGLREWRFSHLLSAQAPFANYQYVINDSPYFDLSQGFEHYHKGRGKSAAKFISHIFQKDRKAGRDLGEVRLEIDHEKTFTLTRLLEWKIDQCRRTGIPCVLEIDWVNRLHHRILEQRGADFSGAIFSLYIGDCLAAAFFCLRSGSVLQGSLLGYDRTLGPYAPGLVLLMRVAQQAERLGISRIDMGSGGDEYKEKLASGCDRVSEGSVPSRALFTPLYQRFFYMKDRLRATRLRGPVQRVRRWLLMTRVRRGHTN